MSDGAGGNGAAMPEELRTYAASKGWDRLAPEAWALEATKAHREATTILRARDEKMVRLPDAPDDPAWAGVWERFGAPKDAAGYRFDDVKLADGTPAPPEITEAMRAAAAKHHLPVAAAAEMTATAIGAVERGQEAARVARFAAEKAALDVKWGQNKDRNLYHASIAARIMGADSVDAFEGAKGYGAIMEGLAALGARTGEAPHLTGQGTVGQGALTPGTAQERLTELRKDRAFYVKLTDPKAEGHADAQKLWADLNRASVAQR